MTTTRSIDAGVTRRTLLRGAVGVGVAAVGFASVDTVAAQADPDYGGWFGPDAEGGAVDNFEGTFDYTGRDRVAVEVGADGNGGTFAFEPAAMRIDPGTTVAFEWTSNTHNVVVEDRPDGGDWQGHEPIENQGFSFEHTFETEGIYTYYCQPHLSLGMKGAIVVGGSGGISPDDGASKSDGGSGSDDGSGGGSESSTGGDGMGGPGRNGTGGPGRNGAGGPGGGGDGGRGGGQGLGAGGGPRAGGGPGRTGLFAVGAALVVAFLSPVAFAVVLLLNRGRGGPSADERRGDSSSTGEGDVPESSTGSD